MADQVDISLTIVNEFIRMDYLFNAECIILAFLIMNAALFLSRTGFRQSVTHCQVVNM